VRVVVARRGRSRRERMVWVGWEREIAGSEVIVV